MESKDKKYGRELLAGDLIVIHGGCSFPGSWFPGKDRPGFDNRPKVREDGFETVA
jgi:hypothetical protein